MKKIKSFFVVKKKNKADLESEKVSEIENPKHELESQNILGLKNPEQKNKKNSEKKEDDASSYSYLDKRIFAIEQSTRSRFPIIQKLNEKLRLRFKWYYNLRIDPLYQFNNADDQMFAIQRSTRTTFKPFQHLHEIFRERFGWYYKWHLRPFANALHWTILATFSVAMFSAIYLPWTINHKPTKGQQPTLPTSIYEALPGETEVGGDRTESSKKFSKQLPDGKTQYRLAIDTGPIHYKDNSDDQNEQWKNIDLNIQTDAGKQKVTKVPYNGEILDTPGYKIADKKSKNWVSEELLDADGNPVTRTDGSISGNKKTYSDVFQNTDFNVESTTLGLKGNIIIKGPNAPTEFKFKLTSDQAGTKNKHNKNKQSKNLDDLSSIKFGSLKTFAKVWDNKTDREADSNGDPIDYDMTLDDSGILTITVNPPADVIYPITIDPATYTEAASADDASNYGTTTPGDGNYSENATTATLGYNGTNYYMFGSHFSTVSIPTNAQINSAYLSLMANANTNNYLDVNIYGEKVADAGVFAATTHEPYDAYVSRTTSQKNFQLGSITWAAGSWLDTGDMSGVVQEIVDQATWASDNDMAFVLANNGTNNASRVIRTYDYAGNTSGPKFVVTYTTTTNIRTWDGGGADGTCGGAGTANNWSCAANWSADTLPGTGDIAIFNSTSTKNATISSNSTQPDGVRVYSGYSGTITQSVDFTTGTVIINAGTWAMSTKALSTGSGDIIVIGGTLTIGASSGTGLSVRHFLVGTGGTFTASGASKITVSGDFDNANGTFTKGSSTFTLSGSGYVNTGVSGWYWNNAFYNVILAQPNQTTRIVYPLEALNSIHLGTGTVVANNGQSLYLNNGTNVNQFIDDGVTYGTTPTKPGVIFLQASTNPAAPNVIPGYAYPNLDIKCNLGNDTTKPICYSQIQNANITAINVSLTTNQGTCGTSYLDTNGFNITVSGNLYVGISGANKRTGQLNISDGETVDISGDVTIYDGSGNTNRNKIISGTGSLVKVKGSWTNSDTFTAGAGTVEFYGTASGKTINTGASVFYNLSFTGSGGGWTLATNNLACTTLTVTAGTLNAATNNKNITVTNSSGTPVLINGGTLTLGGMTMTIYAGMTVSSGTFTGAAGWLYLAVAGGGGDLAVSGGTFTAPANVYIDTAYAFDYNHTAGQGTTNWATNSSTFTIISYGGNLGQDSYYNLSLYDYDDATYALTGTTSVTNNLAVATYDLGTTLAIADKTLNVKNINYSMSYVGNVITATSGTINVSGNWSDDYGGSPIDMGSASTVNFTATSPTVQTMTGGGIDPSAAFYNLTHSGTGTLQLQYTHELTGNFVNSAGTFDMNSQALGIAGDLSLSANSPFTNCYGLIFNGTSSTITDSNTTKQNLGVVTIADAATLGSSVKMNTITINDTKSLNLGSSGYVLELANAGAVADVLINNGTFTADTSTVKFSATNSGGNINVPTLAYSSLQFTPGSAESYDLTGSLTSGNAMTGSLTIDANTTLNTYINPNSYNIACVNVTVNASGTLFAGTNGSAGTSTFTVSGNWNHSAGTFTYGKSTVNLVGTGELNGGNSNKPFYSLNFPNGSPTQTTTVNNETQVNYSSNLGNGTITTGAGSYPWFIVSTASDGPDTPLATNGATFTVNALNVGFRASRDIHIPGRTYRFFTCSAMVTSATCTLDGDVTATGDATVAGLWSNSRTATLDLNGRNLTVNNANLTLKVGDAAYGLRNGVLKNTSGTRSTVAAFGLSNYSGSGSNQILGNKIDFNITGNWSNADTFTAGDSTVTFSKSSSSQTLTSGGTGAAQTFNNLTHSGAGTLQLATNALKVSGTLVNSNGTFDANDLNVNVAGDFNISGGTYSPKVGGASTQVTTLDGAGGSTQNVSGSTTFYNFTAQAAAARTIKFAASSTTTVTNTLDIDGGAGQLLTLNSITDGTYWNFNVSSASPAVTYVAVKDSNASGGNQITATNSTNSGHNLNWNFSGSTITIDGSCKAFDETTNCPNSETVKVAVGSVLMPQTTTTSSGTWTISGVGDIDSGEIITVFIDGVADANEANAVAKYDGSGNITGVLLYEYHITIGSTDNRTITNTDLALYDNSASADEDIFFEVDANNDLNTDTTNQTDQDKIYVVASNTYRPDSASSGNVTTTHITIAGTITADGNAFAIAGNWLTSGAFDTGASTVTFTGTASGKTINPGGGSPFYNLIFNGSGGEWSPLTNKVHVNNDLTMTAGTFNTAAGTADVEVGGNVACGVTCGTISMTTTNTFTQNVGANKNFGTSVSGTTAWTFYNLTFVASSGSPTIATSTSATGDITVKNVLTLGDFSVPVSLNAGNRTWHLTGSGQPFVDWGGFSAGTSTISYESPTGATITSIDQVAYASITYYNLQTSPASGTPMYTIEASGASFLAGTKVLTNNGEKNIEDIKIGEMVKAYDLAKNQPAFSEVTGTTHKTRGEYYIINHKVRATGNHIFILSDKSQRSVETLKIGDELKTDTGTERIESIENIKDQVEVYDLEVAQYHLFYAEGYLVHNAGGENTGPIISNNFTLTGAGSATVDATGDPDIAVGGNFSIGANQTFTAPWKTTFTIAGNFTNAGTFDANGGTVTLNGTAAQTITSNSQPFYNLTLNNTGTNATANDDIIPADALDINGTLTITDGELRLDTNDPNVTVAGNLTIASAGSWTKQDGGTPTNTFDGLTAATYTDSTATPQNIGIVVLNKTDTVAPATNNKLTLASSMTVDTINVDGTLLSYDTLDLGALGGFTLTIANAGATATVYTVGANAVISPGNSTVKYTATNSSANINVTTTKYHNLQFTPGSAESYDLTGNLTSTNALTGSLTISTNAALDATASNYNITLAGNWSNSGTFTARSGTVTMTGSSASIEGAYATTFNNLTINTAGTVAVNTGLAIASSGTLVITGTLSVASTKTVSLAAASTLTINSSSFLNGAGTARYTVMNATSSLTLNNSGTIDIANFEYLLINTSAAASMVVPATTYGVNTATNLKLWGSRLNGGYAVGFTIASGTLTVKGNLDLYVDYAAVTLTNSNNTNINIGGNLTKTSSFSYVKGTETITMNGTTAQTLDGSIGDLYNLTIANTSAAVSLAANTTLSGTLTINSSATLSTSASNYNISIAGDWTNNGGTFTPGTGTVTFTGNSSAINGTAATQTFYNLIVAKTAGQLLSVGGSTTTLATTNFTETTGNFTAPATFNIAANLILTAGTFTAGTNTNITGNWANNGGTFTPGSNTVTFNGTGAQAINGTAATQTFYNLVVAKTAGQLLSVSGSTTTLTVTNFTETTGNFTPPATFNIAGNLTLTAGTFTAGTNTNVGGNWTQNGGTFTHGTNTVTFNGTTTGHTISPGSSYGTFYNLTFNGSGGVWTLDTNNLAVAGALNVTAGTLETGALNLTVTGTTTLGGGNLTGGNSTMMFWGNLAISNASSTFTASHITDLINASYSRSAGSANWTTYTSGLFVTKDVGFTLPVDTYYDLYLNDYSGGTPTFNLGTGTTTINGSLDINDSAGGPTTLAVGSQTLTVLGTITINSGDILTATSGAINVGGNWTNNSGTFTSGTGTVTFTGNSSVINGTAAAQTFYNIIIAKTAGQLLSVSGSTTTLATTNFTETTGNFTAPATFNIAGNVTLTAGTFTAGANTNITGNWTNNGGTFTPGSNTVTFNGTGAQTINGSSASQTFYNFIVAKTAGQLLDVSGSTTTLAVTNFTETTGDFTPPATFNISGNLTLTSGTFTAGENANIGGNWTNNGGTFTGEVFTVTFNGTGAQAINGTAATQTFGQIKVAKTAGTLLSVSGSTTTLSTAYFTETTGDFTAPATFNIYDTLTLTAGTFTAGANTYIGSYWAKATAATFVPGTNTVTFYAFAAVGGTILGTATTQTFYNLVIAKTPGTTVGFGGSTTTLEVTNFTETTGNFTAPATFNIAGNLTLTAGTFTAGTGTVTFTAASPTTQTLDSGGGVNLNNLTHSGSGTLQLINDGQEVGGDLVNSNGTFDANGHDIFIHRDWTFSGGSFSAGATPGNQTVIFATQNESILTGSTTFNNLTMDASIDGAKTIKFTAGTTQTISSGKTWTLTGSGDGALTLRSTSDDTAWKFDIPANFTAGNYIDVQDSQTDTAYRITPGANTTNSGNNDPGWNFGITFTVDNATLDFGNLIPGNVFTGYTETTVTINWLSGYSLSVRDDVSGANSALLHSDATTKIADYPSAIIGAGSPPTTWSGTGLGISAYSYTGKTGGSIWGTGTTESDSLNKYAGVPQANTELFTNNNLTVSADKARIGYKLVVPNTQKTGPYSGTVTYTATATLP